MTPQELEAEALKLDSTTRAKLAARLWESLKEPSEEEWNELWAAEAMRRNSEMDADPSLGIPAEEVFRRMRAKHR